MNSIDSDELTKLSTANSVESATTVAVSFKYHRALIKPLSSVSPHLGLDGITSASVDESEPPIGRKWIKSISCFFCRPKQ